MNDTIKKFRKRRDSRLGKRCDADTEESSNAGGGKKSGHGNTRLPYGIAKSEGIDTTGMTPNEVWEALGGKGYSAKSAYNALKETKGKGEDKSETANAKIEEATIKPGVSVGSTELSFGHSKESQKDAANKLADYVAKSYERDMQRLRNEGYDDEYNEMSSFVKDVKAFKNKSVEEAKAYSKEFAEKWQGTEYAGRAGRFKALYEIDPEAKPKYGKYADGHRFWIHI